MKVSGSGHIRPKEEGTRCRKWQLVLNTEAGRKTRIVHGTKREAMDALEVFRDEVASEVASTERFHAYADAWLRYREATGELESGTLQNLGRDVRTLKRATDSRLLLTDMDAEFWRNKLIDIKHGNNSSGRVLTNTYMGDIYDTAKAIFDQALDDGKISKHPFAGIKRPSPDTPEKPCLSPERLSAFLDALDEEPLDGRVMALYFICEMGLRRGEACALTVDDVVTGKGLPAVRINKAVKDRHGTIGETKTNAGTRTFSA